MFILVERENIKFYHRLFEPCRNVRKRSINYRRQRNIAGWKKQGKILNTIYRKVVKNRNSSKAVMTIHKLRASMKVNRSFRSEAVKNTRMIRVKQRSRNIYCHRSFSPVNRSPVNMGTTEEEGSNSCDSSTAGRTSDCGSMGTSRVENCDSSSDDDFDESYEQSATEQDTHIYDGAQITVNESVTAILSFFLRYDLSAACLSSTLDLISLHCKKENLLIKSLYKLKKYFQRIETPIKRHYLQPVQRQLN